MTLKEFKRKTETGFTRKELSEGIEVEGKLFFIEHTRGGRYWSIFGNGRQIATRCTMNTIYNLIEREIRSNQQ